MDNLFQKFYFLFNKIENITIEQSINCLSQAEIKLLTHLSDKAISMNELSDSLNITMGTATTAVSKLVIKNFINRRRDSDDRRVVLVSLTEKGIKAKYFYSNFRKEISEKLIKNINKKDLESFNKVFLEILVNLEKFSNSLKPKLLIDFDDDELVQIKNINGIKNQSFLVQLSIFNKSILKVEKVDDNFVYINQFNKKGKIPKSIAKNIVAVKKYDVKW